MFSNFPLEGSLEGGREGVLEGSHHLWKDSMKVATSVIKKGSYTNTQNLLNFPKITNLYLHQATAHMTAQVYLVNMYTFSRIHMHIQTCLQVSTWSTIFFQILVFPSSISVIEETFYYGMKPGVISQFCLVLLQTFIPTAYKRIGTGSYFKVEFIILEDTYMYARQGS